MPLPKHRPKSYHIPVDLLISWDVKGVWIGMALLGIGIFIKYGYWMGFLLLLPLPFLFGLKKGMELNFGTNTYRFYISVWGVAFGSWQPFPVPEYLSIYQRMVRNTDVDSVHYNKLRKGLYILQFVSAGYQRTEIDHFHEMEEALEVARQISRDLQLEVLDATTADREWLGIL